MWIKIGLLIPIEQLCFKEFGEISVQRTSGMRPICKLSPMVLEALLIVRFLHKYLLRLTRILQIAETNSHSVSLGSNIQ